MTMISADLNYSDLFRAVAYIDSAEKMVRCGEDLGRLIKPSDSFMRIGLKGCSGTGKTTFSNAIRQAQPKADSITLFSATKDAFLSKKKHVVQSTADTDWHVRAYDACAASMRWSGISEENLGLLSEGFRVHKPYGLDIVEHHTWDHHVFGRYTEFDCLVEFSVAADPKSSLRKLSFYSTNEMARNSDFQNFFDQQISNDNAVSGESQKFNWA